MTLRKVKPAIIASGVMLLLASLPQIYLCYTRGSQWNGEYAYNDTDELAYSAYVNALINGRPRRNDPYTGPDNNEFETLFSIQCLPAYSLAIPARAFNLSASTAFIILSSLTAVASLLALYSLLVAVTGRRAWSALCAGAVLTFAGLLGQAPWNFFAPHLAFPFLRRYTPAFGFPFFLAFPLCVWRALVKKHLLYAVIAGSLLIILIYSYFFLWTAIVAWLVILGALWLLLSRAAARQLILPVIAVIAMLGLCGLGPYLWLLGHRNPTLDGVVSLEFTHRPALLHGPEIYAAIVMVVALIVARPRKVWRTKRAVFALSFLIVPFAIYNQQVLTGRSIQPFHYDQFVTNYWVLIGSVLVLGTFRRWSNAAGISLSVLIIAVALAYAHITAYARLPKNIEADDGRAVALRLADKGTVFVTDEHLTNSLATSSTNPVLWARYMYTFSLSSEEQRRRFLLYLYYTDVDAAGLRRLLTVERGVARVEIFGAARANPVLSNVYEPITDNDVEQAVLGYTQFRMSVGRSDATNPVLSYALVKSGDDLSNLDRWYERDAGERVGPYTLYRLKLRE